MKRIAAIVGVLLGLMAAGANASVFEGRNALNQIDLTCTVSGPTKCTSFYDSNLNITILNNWNIGRGVWDGSASPSATSAQGIAATAGYTATGLSGWVLPTGNGYAVAGAANQYLSIWTDVGGTLAGLQAQFDDVTVYDGAIPPKGYYWSSNEWLNPVAAWFFTTMGGQGSFPKNYPHFAVAVRNGDVAASVPEPSTVILLSLSLGVLALVARRKQARKIAL
jgi:hypothetical protein